MRIFTAALLAATAAAAIATTETQQNAYDLAKELGISLPPATACNTRECHSESDCQCPSAHSGSGLPLEDIPQFVMLSFDDAVNAAIKHIYEGIFREFSTKPEPTSFNVVNRKTKCSWRATFFVSHDTTDYTLVNKLWKQGHEIASHTISHAFNKPEGLKDVNTDLWNKEIEGGRRITTNLANLPKGAIKGFRAPHLQPGGDNMYEVLGKLGMLYDSTLVAAEPTWPYRMNYAIDTCWIPPCNSKAFALLWQVPLSQFVGADGKKCSMADDCNLGRTAHQVSETLMANFNRFHATRVPFPMFIHAPWLHRHQHHILGFTKFFNELSKKAGVHFVTISEVIEWVRKPVTEAVYAKTAATKCAAKNRRKSTKQACNKKTCFLTDLNGNKDAPLTLCDSNECPKRLNLATVLKYFKN